MATALALALGSTLTWTMRLPGLGAAVTTTSSRAPGSSGLFWPPQAFTQFVLSRKADMPCPAASWSHWGDEAATNSSDAELDTNSKTSKTTRIRACSLGSAQVLHINLATFAPYPCKQACCPDAQVKGGPRSVTGYLDAERQEEAMVFSAAHAGRQLEPGCQRLQAEALVDPGHVQGQLNCPLALARRCTSTGCDARTPLPREGAALTRAQESRAMSRWIKAAQSRLCRRRGLGQKASSVHISMALLLLL